MTTGSFEKLKRAVESESVADQFFNAVFEWDVVELEERLTADGECVCGQQNLVKMFTIRNHHNGVELFPIGSHCVNHFGRQDLDIQVKLFSDLLSLRKRIRAGQQITLTSECFSRAVLKWLLDEGAFPADQWNRYDGKNDYLFLIEMFNKRNKAAFSVKQEAKIYQMLKLKVIPFVRDHEALG